MLSGKGRIEMLVASLRVYRDWRKVRKWTYLKAIPSDCLLGLETPNLESMS
jgi:hypothetical protein